MIQSTATGHSRVEYLNGYSLDLTELKGIYSWSRCREGLKACYESNLTEEKNWCSYMIKLRRQTDVIKKPKKILVLGSGAHSSSK
jgi:hypothetical protein